MKSEMHNLGYIHISTVTSHCFAYFILGKISGTNLNIPASYIKGIQVCTNKGPGPPLQKGRYCKNRVGSLIFFPQEPLGQKNPDLHKSFLI
jgi:hypothetical protein